MLVSILIQVIEFIGVLQKRKSVYGYLHQSTIDSLFLDSLPVKRTTYVPITAEDCLYCYDEDVWTMIVKVIVHGLQNMCLLNVMQVII